MTTQQQEARYEAEHVATYNGRSLVVYNPNGVPMESLPVVYGFNNGSMGWYMSAIAIAEDGTHLHDHACSSEAYMPYDLGLIEGSRAGPQEKYSAHYPDGYRCVFVSADEVGDHAGINAALGGVR